MAQGVELDIQGGLARLTLSREHGNAINAELVEGLLEATSAIESNPSIRGVLLAAEGRLFCPGLDLQELVDLERGEMREFVLRFNRAVLALYSLSRPMLAALHGHAVAGGCVLAMTADWRVLSAGALVGLNEVRVGVPLPYGVATILRESVPRTHLEEVALLGRNYRGEEALKAGLVHAVLPAEGFHENCRSRLEEILDRDSRAMATTKRYLRSSTVERIREGEELHVEEFLDGWFSDETRQRIRALVDSLLDR